jgi:hypothetical protein
MTSINQMAHHRRPRGLFWPAENGRLRGRRHIANGLADALKSRIRRGVRSFAPISRSRVDAEIGRVLWRRCAPELGQNTTVVLPSDNALTLVPMTVSVQDEPVGQCQPMFPWHLNAEGAGA